MTINKLNPNTRRYLRENFPDSQCLLPNQTLNWKNPKTKAKYTVALNANTCKFLIIKTTYHVEREVIAMIGAEKIENLYYPDWRTAYKPQTYGTI